MRRRIHREILRHIAERRAHVPADFAVSTPRMQKRNMLSTGRFYKRLFVQMRSRILRWPSLTVLFANLTASYYYTCITRTFFFFWVVCQENDANTWPAWVSYTIRRSSNWNRCGRNPRQTSLSCSRPHRKTEYCCTTAIPNTWPSNCSTDASESVMTWEIIPFPPCTGTDFHRRQSLVYLYNFSVVFAFLYSFEMVADGKQHVVELLAIRKNFTLRVDGGVARSIINEGSRDYLRLTSPLYIGGIPLDPGVEAFNHFHLRNLTSFNG